LDDPQLAENRLGITTFLYCCYLGTFKIAKETFKKKGEENCFWNYLS